MMNANLEKPTSVPFSVGLRTPDFTQAAFFLTALEEEEKNFNSRPQILLKWVCLENGPNRPIRINGRLAWKVSDLQKLLNGEVL